jgi:hypothetical protein
MQAGPLAGLRRGFCAVNTEPIPEKSSEGELMSTKFDNPQAEELYYHQPEDEAGDSVSGSAWYGLYQLEAVILTEDSRGFVWLHKYETTDELNQAWELIIQNTYPGASDE